MLAISDTLARAQTTLENIVKVQVWLSSMEHFSEFNAAYSAFFPKGFRPGASSLAALLLIWTSKSKSRLSPEGENKMTYQRERLITILTASLEALRSTLPLNTEAVLHDLSRLNRL
ncbi:putative endoribonuclease L-PSP [Salmonella enterica]|nr:putative endoribonuclease L-PSP [Salmonella enterica]